MRCTRWACPNHRSRRAWPPDRHGGRAAVNGAVRSWRNRTDHRRRPGFQGGHRHRPPARPAPVRPRVARMTSVFLINAADPVTADVVVIATVATDRGRRCGRSVREPVDAALGGVLDQALAALEAAGRPTRSARSPPSARWGRPARRAGAGRRAGPAARRIGCGRGGPARGRRRAALDQRRQAGGHRDRRRHRSRNWSSAISDGARLGSLPVHPVQVRRLTEPARGGSRSR